MSTVINLFLSCWAIRKGIFFFPNLLVPLLRTDHKYLVSSFPQEPGQLEVYENIFTMKVSVHHFRKIGGCLDGQ